MHWLYKQLHLSPHPVLIFHFPFCAIHQATLSLFVRTLSCPVMLLDILVGEFGWGGFKIQTLRGKANKVLVLPWRKSDFTLPALV